jgi:replicative DNA helicase
MTTKILGIVKRMSESWTILMSKYLVVKEYFFEEGLNLAEKAVEFLTNKSPEEVTGALTGLIDLFTGGYQSGELIIGYQPGMGKTAKMMKCAVENAKGVRCWDYIC